MKIRLTISIVLSLISISVSAQNVSPKDLMRQFRYGEAIEILQTQPETTENLLLKAECFEKMYDYRSAITAYDKALAAEPDNLSLIISLAECQLLAGNAEESLKYWTFANEASPQNLFLKIKKAMAHYRASDWRGTIVASDEVFAQDSVPTLLRMTGDAYLNMGNSVGTLYYRAAIDKNPTDYLAVGKLCDFFYSQQMYDSVINLSDWYLREINPDQKSIGQLNGMANYSSGNYKASIERLKRNTELGDSTYTTTYFLGMAYYASKLYFDATRWLEIAYKQKSDDIRLLFYFGTALARTYDPKKGLEVLTAGEEKIAEFNEMLYDFDLSFAQAYSRIRDTGKSLERFKAALKKRPDNYSLLYNIAYTYDGLKDYKNALSYYEQFLKTKPKALKTDLDAEEDKTTSAVYYRISAERVSKLKEELFFEREKK